VDGQWLAVAQRPRRRSAPRVADRCERRTRLLGLGGHRRHDGRADTRIDTRIDTASRSVTVRAVFPNGNGRLLPGMMMTVGIETNPRTALAVPEQTLVPVETRQYVYLVSDDGNSERREVKIGARIPGLVEILSGLKEGDSLVFEGTLRMRPGATVKIADSQGQQDGDRRDGGDRRP
jgi:membrane fusion protein (multidrug efflux system)